MTIYSFDDYPDDELVFDPTGDVLTVGGGSASYLRLADLADGSGVTLTKDSKSLTLIGVSLESLNESNVVIDLGKLVNAYVGNSFSTDLHGTEYDDQLIGGPADRAIESVCVSAGGDSTGVYAIAPTVSSEGRFVVFESNALHQAGSTGPDGVHDIWMKDLVTGDVTRISSTSGGVPGNLESHAAMVAGDGRSVVFETDATNLKSGDTNGVSDIYLKNLVTGEVTRVSTGTDGHQGTGGGSFGASATHDGRYVVFESQATNLVTGDANSASDIFVKDTQLGTLTLVSTTTSGTKGNAGSSGLGSRDASISADGNFVVFTSWSSNLATGDTDGNADVFVKNLATGQLTCVSTDALDQQVSGDSMNASISAKGRYVVFESASTLLEDGQNGAGAIYLRDLWTGQLTRVKGQGTTDQAGISISGDGRYVVFVADESLDEADANDHADVYVKDMQTGEVKLVSQSHLGEAGNGQSLDPRISLDGSTIVFSTDASNLVSGDANQAASTMVVTNPLFSTTLSGGWGDDRYHVSSLSDQVVELDGEGQDTVETSLSFVLPDHVEILLLTGADSVSGTGNSDSNWLYGNSAGNLLVGGGSNDYLDGGLGADTMRGGADQDLYQVDNAGDVIIEAAGEGIDKVTSSISYTLSAEVENLTLKGVATALDATGNALDNSLVGNWNANVLDGKGGADTMEGGAGDDTYIVDNAGDSVVEGGDDLGDDWGTDLVKSSVSFTLSTLVENLTLTGTAAINGIGNSLNNAITGNSSSNALNGAAGDDTLSGGAGADTLTGSSGNDTYDVDNAADQTIELASGGTDLVRSSISWTLQNAVENLALTGTAAIAGTGNSLANALAGNSAANALDGAAGADTMTGGAGNDTYFVDNTGDKTVEVAAGGTDLVQSSISFTLQAEVENLTLAGSSAVNGTGNSLANTLNGNSAANVLNGGAGADTMIGGGGNDTYVVDNAGDRTNETYGGGFDLVRSSVSFTLSDDIESLTLTGSSAIDGTGNWRDNTIVGNSAANVIDGGNGTDTMIGGAGNDTYFINDWMDIVQESANGGIDLVQSSISWTLGDEFEDLTLLGGDLAYATGNAKANKLTGNVGDNRLDGLTGADTMTGAAGNDTYVVDNIGDRTVELAMGGNDSVESTVSWTLSANLEMLYLRGASAINGSGNAQDNLMFGNSEANVLDGGAGVDTLAGGAGNDTYIVDNGDLVNEVAGDGIDEVQASVAWTLQSNVENLTLTGSSAINGTGNSQANILDGNSAANVLNGASGVDTMTGGAGNDTYVVDNAGDRTIEVAGGGIDLVQSSITFMLQAEVEKLTLTGSSAINGVGNALANTIAGNAGANVIDGKAGADTMTGGAGNDIYIVDDSGDLAVESAAGGTDLVRSSVSLMLKAELENLTLTGSAAINGLGNTLANTVTGNAAANVIDGKAGFDTLTGGAGNDIFAFTSTVVGWDLITDFASGADKVRIGQSAIRIGDGDTAIEGAVTVNGPNGFAAGAELVVVTHDIAGSITGSSAAAAIGHADSAYAVGDSRLFVVDNGSDSVIYLFYASDADATVSADELTMLATLDNSATISTNDFLFGA
jgi:Ca2+-binding RTX toxin-like protein